VQRRDESMPRVTVEILKGRSLEQKRRLVKEIDEAVAEFTYVPTVKGKGCLCRILEIDPENLSWNGEMISEILARGDKPLGNFEPRLTLQYVAGRLDDMGRRKGIIRRFTKLLSDILEVPEENTQVYLLEMPPTHFSVNGILKTEGS
jgi:phenylpyruvate tautomerase PptA (4-oxalocrotonate tautomerase family)